MAPREYGTRSRIELGADEDLAEQLAKTKQRMLADQAADAERLPGPGHPGRAAREQETSG